MPAGLQYPAMVVQHGLGGANVPFINYIYPMPSVDDFNVYKQEFDDKGADFLVLSDNRVRRWGIWYPAVKPAEAQVLDDFLEAVKGSGYGFLFAHPRDGTLYQNCRIVEYEAPEHEKFHIQQRRVVIEQLPT